MSNLKPRTHLFLPVLAVSVVLTHRPGADALLVAEHLSQAPRDQGNPLALQHTTKRRND